MAHWDATCLRERRLARAPPTGHATSGWRLDTGPRSAPGPARSLGGDGTVVSSCGGVVNTRSSGQGVARRSCRVVGRAAGLPGLHRRLRRDRAQEPGPVGQRRLPLGGGRGARGGSRELPRRATPAALGRPDPVLRARPSAPCRKGGRPRPGRRQRGGGGRCRAASAWSRASRASRRGDASGSSSANPPGTAPLTGAGPTRGCGHASGEWRTPPGRGSAAVSTGCTRWDGPSDVRPHSLPWSRRCAGRPPSACYRCRTDPPTSGARPADP